MLTLNRISSGIRCMTATLVLAHSLAGADELPPLAEHSLNLDLSAITVSGVSSGGYMATQFHFAHADWVSGMAAIASGPMYCGQNDIKTALSQCVSKQEPPISLPDLDTYIQQAAGEQALGPLEALKDSKVWLLSGTKDTRVAPSVTQALFDQYSQYVNKANITFVNDKPFAHHFPTLDKGTGCDVSEAPFVGNCNYDAAGELLTHLLGPLSAPAETSNGNLYQINQQILGGKAASTLADDGLVYVPQSCLQGQSCQLHISFHGCNQNQDAIGDDFARLSGYNRWADSNQLVVLYPQTKSSMFMPLNPQGCWDWWGYTDEHYATRNGQQIQAVSAMVNALNKTSQESK